MYIVQNVCKHHVLFISAEVEDAKRSKEVKGKGRRDGKGGLLLLFFWVLNYLTLDPGFYLIGACSSIWMFPKIGVGPPNHPF